MPFLQDNLSYMPIGRTGLNAISGGQFVLKLVVKPPLQDSAVLHAKVGLNAISGGQFVIKLVSTPLSRTVLPYMLR